MDNGKSLEDLEGVYSTEDMQVLGNSLHMCPYILSKELFNKANIVVFNYMYMLGVF